MNKVSCVKSFLIVTLISFLMTVMLPFFAVYNPQLANAGQVEQSNQDISSLFGDKVIICTPDGFKFVSWSDLSGEGSKDQPSPNPHTPFKCPLCVINAHGLKAALPTQESEINFSRAAVYLRFYTSDDVHLSQQTRHRFQTRAPPATT